MICTLRMATVTVLMSTYNGEKYLEEQIDSIVKQEGVNVKILVRDDGSTDGTQKMLDQFQEKGILHWYQEQRIIFLRFANKKVGNWVSIL